MKRTEKVLRYSIRKSVLGVSSVLICALFLGHSMVAADEERPVANAVETPVAAPNWHWAESASRGSWCRRNRRI